MDGRANTWLYRLQLIAGDGEVLADTHPNDDSGPLSALWQARGLLPLAADVTAVVEQFHAPDIPEGLDEATWKRRIKSLRVKLVRHKGEAVEWAAPYVVGGADFTALVTLEKAT